MKRRHPPLDIAGTMNGPYNPQSGMQRPPGPPGRPAVPGGHSRPPGGLPPNNFGAQQAVRPGPLGPPGLGVGASSGAVRPPANIGMFTYS